MLPTPGPARRGRRVWPVVALVVVLAASGGALGTTLTSTLHFDPALGASAVPSGVPPQPSFAVRTGFANLPLAAVAPLGPAQGTSNIVITFDPTNSALFDPPAAGAPPLTSAEVANKFGLTPAAYAAAEQYFENRGLTVSHAWTDRLSLSLVGPSAAVNGAFATTLLSGRYEGRAVTFPSSAPSLPSNFESEISSVAGLSTGFTSLSLPELPEPSPAHDSSGPDQNPNDLVTPSIARDIYGISGLYNLTSTPTYATGKGIVLLLWGEGYAPSDISTFFAQDYPASFPKPTVTAYPVDGAPEPSPGAVNDPSNASRELTLDLEWSGSMAPGANLDAVYAPDGPATDGYSPSDTSMIDALDEAVDTSDIPNVASISMSFGSPDGADAALQNGFESDFAIAGQEHIGLFAATGDLGGDAGPVCTDGPQPEYPAASTYTVAVGGTSVSLDRGTLGGVTGFSETAWDMSGGGFSVDYAAPSWQEVGSAAAPISANGHRGTPDVAATAGYNFLYFDSANDAGGGTSFATPLWAGMITEMDALRTASAGKYNFGFMTPALYDLGANTTTTHPAYNDITSGGNCLGPAGPGWDTATGWGSPIAVNLYEHLVASFVNLPIAVSPSPVAPGGSVTISVTVLNASSGTPVAGVPVAISLATNSLVSGPCSGTFGSGTPITNTAGVAVVTISVPGCYLGSSALASATITSDGYYGTNSSTVPVNLLGFAPGLAALATFPDNVILFVLIMAIAIALGVVLGRRTTRRAGSDIPVVAAAGPPPSAPPAAPPVAAAETTEPPLLPTASGASAAGPSPRAEAPASDSVATGPLGIDSSEPAAPES